MRQLACCLLSERTDRLNDRRHVRLAEVLAHLLDLECEDIRQFATRRVIIVRDVEFQFGMVGIDGHLAVLAAVEHMPMEFWMYGASVSTFLDESESVFTLTEECAFACGHYLQVFLLHLRFDVNA
ncbi:MAG: hypothetical protein IIW75_01050 [Bacteroidaceae bacterium]|nr:hypothetical protein [Bacteroidaceae bacterium]